MPEHDFAKRRGERAHDGDGGGEEGAQISRRTRGIVEDDSGQHAEDAARPADAMHDADEERQYALRPGALQQRLGRRGRGRGRVRMYVRHLQLVRGRVGGGGLGRG